MRKQLPPATQLDGSTFAWRYGRVYRLLDGTAWKLDDSAEGKQLNAIAAIKERLPKGSVRHPLATITTGRQCHYLQVGTMGRKRRVVPVDPSELAIEESG